jgi:hypothetical protein
MKRVFSTLLPPLLAGLGLRVLFILKFPANSGDTILYEQMASNWLQHHVYAMNVNGAIQPVDLRMPGYPAFLAVIYWLTGKTGAAAHGVVMLAQALVDLADCVLIAVAGVTLVGYADSKARGRPVFAAGLWLSALCPFIGNYSATLLTEVIAVFCTSLALFFFVWLAANSGQADFLDVRRQVEQDIDYRFPAIPAGLATGIGTLFRPETPLLLAAAWAGNAFALWPRGRWGHWLRIVLVTGMACVVPLLPWALRNAITLHELQPLAPKNSNLPGELVPRGFMAWEKTWLYKVSDCYVVSWKLNDDVINLQQVPARAFDNDEEKERVAAILEQYNDDLTLTPEEDAAFAQLARERTQRHPLRRYVVLPMARAFTLWFTPRIELLPVSGTVFPLQQSWQDDKVDQSITLLFFVLNIVYVALGLYGAWRLWRWSAAVRPAVFVLVFFVVLRTAFLTTLETPEPRYVLECFPALIACAATIFGKPWIATSTR